ncbi:hypothetical protein SteCoe_26473 [Stentor coeruleus]|uniref:START domain-containing protein n=1 Tax=Stentor coeruleus TaxID=5963 RepID=A0A1R2BCU2_9CILI|nr:hypothetical protein SteCoe_26473 [Stentor coeruleus]
MSCFPNIKANSYKKPIKAPQSYNNNEINLNEEMIDTFNEDSKCKTLETILGACKDEFLLVFNRPLEEDAELVIDKNGFKTYGQDCNNGFLLKSSFFSEADPETFLSYLTDTGTRQKWDKNIEKITKVALAPHIDMIYTRFTKFFAISQRDLLTITRCYKDDSGYFLISTSYENQEFPVDQNIMRIQIFIAGYFIQSLNGGSKVFAVTQGNFGGILPQKAMRTTVAMSFHKFQMSMETAMAKKIKS